MIYNEKLRKYSQEHRRNILEVREDMKAVKFEMLVVVGVAVCLAFAYPVDAQQSRLIIVANDANYELAQPWINLLQGESVPFLRIKASEFEKYKKEKYFAILGGPNEIEGIGDIVKQVLTKEEIDFVSQPGNSKMYLKNDVWQSGQRVIVFAGGTKEAAARARTSTRERWIGYLNDWFDTQISSEALVGY